MHSPVIKSDLCNMETIWIKYLSAQNHQQNRIQRPETELFWRTKKLVLKNLFSLSMWPKDPKEVD